MFKKDKKKMIKAFTITLILIAYIIFLQKSEIYSPITYFTGLKTPTTGMTRAWLSVLRGDISGAFTYNAMFLLAPFLAGTTFLYLWKKENRYLKLAIFIATILFVYNIMRII